MAELNNTGTGQWSETDANNTSPPPDGAPVGTFPNQAEGIWRAIMGALKRFWDRVNATVTTTGSSGTYTYTPSNNAFPTAYVTGEIYTIVADKDSVGGDVININALGNKNLKKYLASGKAAIAAADIKSGGIYHCVYDGTDVIVLNPSAAPGTVLTNSLAADVLLNNQSAYFDGPSVAQGTSGTWFASGTVFVLDTSASAGFLVKLWDGTTVIASGVVTTLSSTQGAPISLSGYLASPAGNIRISVKDLTSTNGKMTFNSSGNSKDCTITVVRVQ